MIIKPAAMFAMVDIAERERERESIPRKCNGTIFRFCVKAGLH